MSERKMRTVLAAWVTMWAVCVGPASGQAVGQGGGQGGGQGDARAVGYASERGSAAQVMATEAQRLARVSLRGGESVSEPQRALAGAWLEVAKRLEPGWAEPLALSVELARERGDTPAVIEALGAYLKAVPDDASAKLALIEARVSALQTLDERLNQLERVLDMGERSGLSRPLRSRLASLAAALATEQGDPTRRGRWLKEALSLDATNPMAIEQAYALAVEREAGAVELGTMAVLRVRALPTEFGPRATLGAVLMGEAAYSAAADQLGVAAEFRRAPLDRGFVETWVFALGAASRTDEALGLLRDYEASLATAGEAGGDDRASDGGLSDGLAIVRLLLLATSSFEPHRATAQEVYAAMRARWTERAEAGDAEAVYDLAWLAGVTGLELETAAAALEGDALDSDKARRAAGWVAAARGDIERARELLAPLAETDAWARLGMAMLLPEAQGERRGALLRFVHAYPAQTAGLYAARTLLAESGDVPPTRTGLVLLRLMKRSPERLWRPNLRFEPWTLLAMEPTSNRYAFGEPIELRVTLENRSRMPMSIGAGGVLPTTVLISATASRPAEGRRPIEAVAVDLGRRLTLDAGEDVVVPVRLSSSGLGALMLESPWAGWSVRMGGLLNPATGPRGQLGPGVLGARADAGPVVWGGVSMAGLDVEAEAAKLASERAGERLAAIARLATLSGWVASGEPGSAEVSEAQTQQAGDALALAFERLDEAERGLVVRLIGTTAEAERAYGRVLDQARRSTSPLVGMLMLWRHATGPEDGLVTEAMRSGDAGLRSFAEALVAAWEAGVIEPGGEAASAPSGGGATPGGAG
jgi:hypothetical protein